MNLEIQVFLPNFRVCLSCHQFVCICHVTHSCVFDMSSIRVYLLRVYVMSLICVYSSCHQFVFVMSSICLYSFCHQFVFVMSLICISHLTNLYLSGYQFLFFTSPICVFIVSSIWICLVNNLYLSCHQFLHHATPVQYIWI